MRARNLVVLWIVVAGCREPPKRAEPVAESVVPALPRWPTKSCLALGERARAASLKRHQDTAARDVEIVSYPVANAAREAEMTKAIADVNVAIDNIKALDVATLCPEKILLPHEKQSSLDKAVSLHEIAAETKTAPELSAMSKYVAFQETRIVMLRMAFDSAYRHTATLTFIVARFKENALAAETAFAGRQIEMTATVRGARRNNKGEPFIEFANESSLPAGMCFVDGSNVLFAESVKAGQSVTVRGVIDRFESGILVLTNCKQSKP